MPPLDPRTTLPVCPKHTGCCGVAVMVGKPRMVTGIFALFVLIHVEDGPSAT